MSRAQRTMGRPRGTDVLGGGGFALALTAAVMTVAPTLPAATAAAATPMATPTATSAAPAQTPTAPAPTAASPTAPLSTVKLVAEPALTVKTVALNRSRVAVSGLNTVPVRITVTASYPTAAQGGDDRTSLTAILTRSPKPAWPALSAMFVPLKRVGTAQSPGTWTGFANVPATLHGTLKVSALSLAPAHVDTGNMTPPTPVDGPSLRVAGVHVPAIAAVVSPRRPAIRSRSYAIRGRVYDTATRAPYRSRIPVQLVIDGNCWRTIPCTVRTDRRGRFTFSIRNTPIGSPPSRPVTWGHNLWLTGAAKDADGFGTLILVRPVAVR